MKHILIILLIIPVAVFSQSKTDNSYHSWNSIIIDYSITNQVYLKNEAHVRRINFLKNGQQILIRPSIHYSPNTSLDFSTGYSYSKNIKERFNFNENNVWEQLQLSHGFGKSKFKHRFRFEQRFIDRVIENADANFIKEGTDFKMRFRYRFTWDIPLLKIVKNKTIKATLFDEIWLNTNSGVVPKSLNQNWFYIGLSYPILKHISLGVGYLNAFAPVNTTHFKSSQILQTTLKFHIK